VQPRFLLETLGVVLVVFVALVLVVLPEDRVLSIDGFYHATILRLMWETGPIVDIRWLPLTVLGVAGPDHHWLWHVLLSPFGAFEPVLGLKLALAFNASLVPAVFYFVCRMLGVRRAWLWTLLLLAGGLPFVSRLVMLRAQTVAIVLLLLTVLAVLQRRPVLLACIGFLAMASYHGAIIIVVPVAVHFLVRAGRDASWDLRLPLCLSLGIALGLLLNPWFPENVEYLLFHTLLKGTNTLRLQVGPEWAPAPWFELLRWSWLAHALVLAACVGAWFVVRSRLTQTATLTLLLTTLVTLVAFKSAQRFVEFYLPIALLAAATLGSACLDALPKPRQWAAAGVLAVIAWVEIVATVGYYDARAQTRFTTYERIGAELDSRAAPGSLVFNAHWDDFPFLLWHTQRPHFVSGLDPHFLGVANPELSQLWHAIVGAQLEPEATARAIRDDFGAEWAVLRNYDRALHQRLVESDSAELVLATDWGSLFRLHTQAP
jgi:hypothetical protein